jgi:hypothetical protein
MSDYKYEQLNRELLSKAVALCHHLLPGGKVKGGDYKCSDIRGGSGDSFSVRLCDGVWKDFADPEQYSGGDLISLHAACTGKAMGESYSELTREWLGNLKAEVSGYAPVQKKKNHD